MGNFDAQRNRYRNATKTQTLRKNDYGGSNRYAEITMQALNKNSTIAMRVLPFVLGKINEVPCIFSRSRVETVRSPEIATPATEKEKVRLDFATVNEWCLAAESYPEGDEEAPQTINAFLEAAVNCGLLVEGEGFKYPSKAVNEALSGLIPWTQFYIPVLARADKVEVSRRQVGDKEYVNYTLKPHKNTDHSTWTPVLLVVNNDRWMQKFFDKADEYCESVGIKNIQGRKTGPLMMFEKNDKGHYDVSFLKDRGGEVPAELWKTLQEEMPDLQSRMDKIKKTDDEICDAFSRAWWWDRVMAKFPAMAEVFGSEVEATVEWDDGDDDEALETAEGDVEADEDEEDSEVEEESDDDAEEGEDD